MPHGKPPPPRREAPLGGKEAPSASLQETLSATQAGRYKCAANPQQEGDFMTTPQVPSRQTLEEVPGRAFKFVIAVAEVPTIAALLATKGYNEAEHDYAWERLGKLAAVHPPAGASILDKGVRDAVVELDAWDEPNFAIIKASLERQHPEQAAFVFEGLEAKQGREAVLSVATLLDRIDALQNGPERKATRKADHAAIATLNARGYGEDERARLRALVDSARKVTPANPPPATGAAREKIVLELYGWLNEWSTVAKSLVKRRDHLIRLGLAKRRATKAQPSESEGEPT
jgi:hypothetical protein